MKTYSWSKLIEYHNEYLKNFSIHEKYLSNIIKIINMNNKLCINVSKHNIMFENMSLKIFKNVSI